MSSDVANIAGAGISLIGTVMIAGITYDLYQDAFENIRKKPRKGMKKKMSLLDDPFG